ncbi:MAG TPA: hypothetical protein VNL77_16220 [Roseiflexaceae bacterium]|nr:hypothetical protein [Roseiflexaceae bacterium]
MAPYSYEQAIQALKDRLGGRWEGDGTGGRDELARVLQEELGASRAEAGELIDGLIESGQLQYVREEAVGGGYGGVIPGAPAAGMGGAPMGAGTGGTSGVPAVPATFAPGYWQIGAGESERGADTRIAREGQVDPTR